MNREIKFRAWDTTNKTMFIPTTYRVKNYVVLMQYTGLKDKNGVEIYEFDIITDGNFNYKITFGSSGCWLAHNPKRGGERLNELLYVMPCKVIGNIYENPELLNNPAT